MDGEVLRDDQWEKLRAFVPGGRKGKRDPRSDGRRFFDASRDAFSANSRQQKPSASTVFDPKALLREARRQKGLALESVPEICVLDPDGDIVRLSAMSASSGMALNRGILSIVARIARSWKVWIR